MGQPAYPTPLVAIASGLATLILSASCGFAQSSLTEEQRGAVDLQISLRAMTDSVFAERFPQTTVPRLLRFSNGQRIGYLHRSGQIAVPPIFRAADSFFNGRAWVNLDGRRGFIDAQGRLRLLTQFMEASDAKNGLFFVSVNGLRGLVDAQERVVADPKFQRIEYWGDKYAVLHNGKWGILDKDGTELVEPRYRQIFLPSDEYRLGAAIEDRWGVVDKNGKVLLPFEYERAKTLAQGFTVVVKNRKWILLAPDGTPTLPGSYDFIRSTSNSSRWIVEDGGQQGVVGLNGTYLLKMDRWRIEPFGNDGAFVVSNRLMAIVDSNGQPLTDFIYERVEPLVGGLAAIEVGGKWGYVDSGGRIVIPPSFSDARAFAQGLAAVSKDGAYGYVDRTGALVIPHVLEDAYSFFPDGAAVAKVKGNYVYIDRNGAIVGALFQQDVATASEFSFAKP